VEEQGHCELNEGTSGKPCPWRRTPGPP
jgi:hypothetical protein